LVAVGRANLGVFARNLWQTQSWGDEAAELVILRAGRADSDRPDERPRVRSFDLTRKQLVIIVAVVLTASVLSALVAYRHGLRRGKVAPSRASVTTVPQDGPCVDITAAGPLVGQPGCVTGRILRVYTSRNGNTFLDFCADYKSCPFTSVVFAEDRAKFGDLGALKGRKVELRGLVTDYQGRAEIIIRDQDQIRMAP
jgi:hypothetical protein